MFANLGYRQLSQVLRNRRGVCTLEFAIFAPVLGIMMLGIVYAGSSILKNGEIGTVAARVADLVTQEEVLTRGDLTRLLGVVPALAGDKDFTNVGKVIVSAVSGDRNGRRRVAWQHADQGRLPAESLIGQPNQTANLPAQVAIAQGETVIAVEVFYAGKRGFLSVSTGAQDLPNCVEEPGACIYKVAFYRGRMSDLAVIASR